MGEGAEPAMWSSDPGPAGPGKRRRSRPRRPPTRGSCRVKLSRSFPSLRLQLSSLSTLLVELVALLVESVVQVLVVGLLKAIGEHIWKPFLEVTFDSLLQPLLLFLKKVLCGLRDLMEPLVDVLRGVCSQLALLLSAARLLEVNLGPRSRTELRDLGRG